jgi:predicted aspartyl protease
VTGGIFLQVIQLDSDWSLGKNNSVQQRLRVLLRAPLFFFRQQIIIGMLATCSLLSSPELTPAASSESTETTSTSPTPSAIWIYSAPDEASLRLGTLAPGETASPIAETQAAGGARWFLIKSKTAVTGWIQQSENDQAKKIDSFFKSQPAEKSNVPATIPNLSSAAASRGTIFVPVLTAGRSAIVTVTLNQTVTGNLMLDTGATHTVISQRLAAILSLRPAGKSAVQTVGGVIAVTISRLRSLKVGEAEVNDLAIIVHDFSRDVRIDGLLGMDFLGRYRFGLDAQRQVLVLSPR